jgi:hypothetical protein
VEGQDVGIQGVCMIGHVGVAGNDEEGFETVTRKSTKKGTAKKNVS